MSPLVWRLEGPVNFPRGPMLTTVLQHGGHVVSVVHSHATVVGGFSSLTCDAYYLRMHSHTTMWPVRTIELPADLRRWYVRLHEYNFVPDDLAERTTAIAVTILAAASSATTQGITRFKC